VQRPFEGPAENNSVPHAPGRSGGEERRPITVKRPGVVKDFRASDFQRPNKASSRALSREIDMPLRRQRRLARRFMDSVLFTLAINRMDLIDEAR
jgi:hypothetical protein